MKNLLIALSFLTVIPLPFLRYNDNGRELSNSAVWFPLVGVLLGLILGSFAWFFLKYFPPAAVVVLVLLVYFFLTRGLHLDGLADTADGLIGTTDREKAFRAMDDSAIGVMGTMAIIFLMLLEIVLLAEIDGHLIPLVLVMMPMAGRWAIVNAGTWFKPARKKGLGNLFLVNLHWPQLLKASIIAALLLALFACWQPTLAIPVIVGCLAALSGSHLLALYASMRLGGISGDILGACSALGELLYLIGFYLAYRHLLMPQILEKAVNSYFCCFIF